MSGNPRKYAAMGYRLTDGCVTYGEFYAASYDAAVVEAEAIMDVFMLNRNGYNGVYQIYPNPDPAACFPKFLEYVDSVMEASE